MRGEKKMTEAGRTGRKEILKLRSDAARDVSRVDEICTFWKLFSSGERSAREREKVEYERTDGLGKKFEFDGRKKVLVNFSEVMSAVGLNFKWIMFIAIVLSW